MRQASGRLRQANERQAAGRRAAGKRASLTNQAHTHKTSNTLKNGRGWGEQRPNVLPPNATTPIERQPLNASQGQWSARGRGRGRGGRAEQGRSRGDNGSAGAQDRGASATASAGACASRRQLSAGRQLAPVAGKLRAGAAAERLGNAGGEGRSRARGREEQESAHRDTRSWNRAICPPDGERMASSSKAVFHYLLATSRYSQSR